METVKLLSLGVHSDYEVSDHCKNSVLPDIIYLFYKIKYPTWQSCFLFYLMKWSTTVRSIKLHNPLTRGFVFCIFRFLRNSINCQKIVLTHVHVFKEYIKYKINEFWLTKSITMGYKRKKFRLMMMFPENHLFIVTGILYTIHLFQYV